MWPTLMGYKDKTDGCFCKGRQKSDMNGNKTIIILSNQPVELKFKTVCLNEKNQSITFNYT